MNKRRLTVLGALAAAAVAALLASFFVAGAAGGGGNNKMRWDIIHLSIDPGNGKIVISAGGTASALAADGSEITLTGSGTFRSNPGNPQDVTGGGTWATAGPIGTASGTYTVTGFVSYVVAPGTVPSATFE